VYVRYFWQKNYHTYGHIRCKCTVLANPTRTPITSLSSFLACKLHRDAKALALQASMCACGKLDHASKFDPLANWQQEFLQGGIVAHKRGRWALGNFLAIAPQVFISIHVSTNSGTWSMWKKLQRSRPTYKRGTDECLNYPVPRMSPYPSVLKSSKFSAWSGIWRIGQNYIFTVYIRYFWQVIHEIYGHIRCIYGIFGREFTKYTVIYGVYIRIWPTLGICSENLMRTNLTTDHSWCLL